MAAMRWLSLSAFSLTLLQPIAPAKSSAQALPIESPAPTQIASLPPEPSSQTAELSPSEQKLESPEMPNSGVTGPEPAQMQFTMAAMNLWTPQDAIAAASAESVGIKPSPPSTAEKGDCRWAPAGASIWADGTNIWGCKIKPLSRYGLPIRDALHHLWPLGHKSGD